MLKVYGIVRHDPAGVKNLAAARRIEGRAVEDHCRTGADSGELFDFGVEVIEERIVIVEALSHGTPKSIRTDDAADVARRRFRSCRLRGRGPLRLSLRAGPRHTCICIEDIEIFQACAGIEQDYRIFGFEESGGAEFAIGSQRGTSFRSSEYAFGPGPVAGGGQNLPALGHISEVDLPSSHALTMGAQPDDCTQTIFGR